MTDTQAISASILAGLTAIAGAIRWSVGRLTKSQDRGISALVENARSHATLTAKFDALMARFEGLAARFDTIVDTLLRDAKLDDSQRSRIVARIAAKAKIGRLAAKPSDSSRTETEIE